MVDGRKKVLMCFEQTRGGRDYWQVWFRCVTNGIYPRRFNFAHHLKIRDLYLRFGTSKLVEDHLAFATAVMNGKGIVDLLLGPEQIAVLENKRAPPGRVGLDTTRRRLG